MTDALWLQAKERHDVAKANDNWTDGPGGDVFTRVEGARWCHMGTRCI